MKRQRLVVALLVGSGILAATLMEVIYRTSRPR